MPKVTEADRLTIFAAVSTISRALDELPDDESRSRAMALGCLKVADGEKDPARRVECYDFAIAFLQHARKVAT